MESKWFVDENVKNIDKEILLCFPYAGASINMFSMWKEYIDKVIVCPVKLPFRDARRKEKLPESVQKLAEVFVKENIDIMRKRYSIFGHCTGAILGYEIARQTYEKTGNEPTVIIASSSQEPAIIPKEAILLAGASDSEIQAYWWINLFWRCQSFRNIIFRYCERILGFLPAITQVIISLIVLLLLFMIHLIQN